MRFQLAEFLAMSRTRQILERMDQHVDRMGGHMVRGNELMQRIDVHMQRNNQVLSEIKHEFELNREVQVALMADHKESHREVMKRLEDLGVHMQQQTEGLHRILAHVDPEDPSQG